MILDKSVTKNFFGRENILEILSRTIADAKDGRAGSVLLSGKPGIGKTKLLANLHNRLFEQRDVIPFFYAPKRSLVSTEDFANDYLVSFILQSLTFMGKETADLSDIYSLEELKEAAREFGARWIADIINEYKAVREEGIEAKIVYNAVSAPYRSYQVTGVPVVVVIDDLHNIRAFCEPKANEMNSGFWTLFEGSIRSMNIPHIFSGVPHEIEKVYFDDTLMADQLEIIDLPALDEKSSVKLFNATSEMLGLKVDLEPSDFVGKFGGNPLYIKNFLQAARHSCGVLSEDVFQDIYDNEVTVGKTYRYWVFLLKKYVRPLDLRKPSLSFLNTLCGDNDDDSSSDTLKTPLLEPDLLEHVAGLLHDSGSIETGFSETRPADDVLGDIIKGLYQKEVMKGAPDKVSELIVANKSEPVKECSASSFIITVPADPKAGLVAIKSLEQIAINYNIPFTEMRKLQLAMADLFSNVLAGDASVESFKLWVTYTENSFSIEITTPQKDLVLSEQDSSRIGAYLDDLKVKNVEDGTVLTLVTETKEDADLPEGD